jgi:hypothetical protein
LGTTDIVWTRGAGLTREAPPIRTPHRQRPSIEPAFPPYPWRLTMDRALLLKLIQQARR